MKKIIFSFFIVFLVHCCTVQNTTKIYNKISQQDFLKQPFGFEESIKNFTAELQPEFKTQKLLRKNTHYPEKTDTIYRFYYKKSEIFFYKTYAGKEFLLAGKIMNKQIELENGIQVGLPRTSFTDRFVDKLDYIGDSIQLIGDGTKYTFIFKKDKLYRINIDNYFD
ncbi:MAG: hypothetical protein A2W99_05620 [Bacteroidetes bacterium GWF2_33_16]|nr:MAG: hypothetical protein A2X00_13275 [Bacteroidetes bacterium GWE2_32_14]OFY05167.1 MAG: hypothetical protein A2W99_05620 [Bacteroidetes bacterium GWF2_33_16]